MRSSSRTTSVVTVIVGRVGVDLDLHKSYAPQIPVPMVQAARTELMIGFVLTNELI